LISAIPATAQDIRLSAEPIKPVVSSGSRVQAVARIGDLSLAVFGTDIDQPGDPVGILRMQLLRDTLPFGNQNTITTPDARPFGWVQVIALRDHFMVLWNDHRGTSWSVYLCNIDTMGNVSREERFLDHPMNRIGILSLQTSSGHLLLWNDSSGVKTIQACTLDSSGKFLTTPHRYADGEFRGAIYPAITTTLAILDRGEPGPLPIDRSGGIVPLPPGALNKFSGIYFLGDDGSVLTNRRDTVREYHSVFDSVPFHSEIIRLPADAIAGTEIVSRDAAGQMQICYAVGGGVISTSAWGGYLGGQVLRVTEVGDGLYSSSATLSNFEIAVVSDARESGSAYPTATATFRGTNNSYRLTIRFQGRGSVKSQGTDHYYDIDRTIRYVTNPNNKSTDTLFPATSITDPGIHAFESPNPAGREIDVVQGSDIGRITVSAPLRKILTPQRNPVVANVDGIIMAGWITISTDSTAEIGYWPMTPDTSVSIVDRLLLTDDMASGGYGMRNILSATGNQIFLGVASWQAVPGPSNSQRYRLYESTDRGWRKLVDINESHRELQITQIGLAVSPDRALIGIALGHAYDNNLYWWRPTELRIFDTAGIERRRIDSIGLDLAHNIGLVLTDRNDIRTIVDALSLRIRSDTTIRDTTGIAVLNGCYTSLPNHMILRSNQANVVLHVDLFDTNGSYVYSAIPIMMPTDFPDYFIAQNPIDSGFAIVCGGSSGVKMIVL
ncbi:MAG: hypothetical protein ABI876_14065, partial [Bacteroidota bacterium]